MTEAPDWKAEGAICATGNHDPDMWFSNVTALIASAKELCQGCPVRQECYDYGRDKGMMYGIWGGMTGTERYNYERKMQMRKKRRYLTRKSA